MATFELSLPYTLENEGGFSNNPNDSGGATNFGITREDYSRWLGHPVSVDDVKNMPEHYAESIYEAWYWSPLKLSLVTSQAVATAIFDMGVNLGIHEASLLAQQTLNLLGASILADGCTGPITVATLNQCTTERFINGFQVRVRAYYQAIVNRNPSQRVFFDGWMNRVERLATLVAQQS